MITKTTNHVLLQWHKSDESGIHPAEGSGVFVGKNRSWINCDLNQGPLYNQPYPVFKATENGPELKQMEWGYIPEESKWPFLKSREDLAKWRFMYTTLNATCEGLFVNDKGKTSMYAGAAQYRRCLVPSTGY